MSRVKVIALHGFEHGGTVSRGDALMLTERHADLLSTKGLVEIVRTKQDEKKKEYSSASQAAPVLTKQTAKPSSGGAKKKPKSKGK